jgi:hypothetical protein
MNIFVLSFDVDGFIHPAVTRLARHGVLDAPRTHWAIDDRDRSLSTLINAFWRRLFKHATNCGKVEEPSSSQSRLKSAARYAASSEILAVILSRSDRALPLLMVNARARMGCEFKRAFYTRLEGAKSSKIVP